MINIKAYNPIYHFLINPRFRIYRHILLILIMGVIATNSVLLVYADHIRKINLTTIIGGYIIVYITIIYLCTYIFIPKLLLKKKYVRFTILFVIITLFLYIGDLCADYYIHVYYNLPFGRYSSFHPDNIPVLEFISSLLLVGVYLSSISVTVFFKNWMQNREKLQQLKNNELRLELDDFKNSISPAFLLNMLHIAATYTQTNPGKASQTLLKLSRVLRYQLYDCKRDLVLLNSEMKFIHGYLELEQMRDHTLAFRINTSELFRPYTVPPLLFISFIEESLKQVNKLDGDKRIEINISAVGQVLTFVCADNRKTNIMEEQADYLKICPRLQFLSNKDYSLELKQNPDLSRTELIFNYKPQCH